MAYDIGARIGIEGEKEYKKAIQDIVSGQKVLKSELELVSAKFEGQEGSIEGLTAKHDVLQRTIYSEQEKIETLRKALKNSAQAFGESDQRTMAWKEKLNRAEAELEKTKKQLKDTDTELENFGNDTVKLGDALDGIAGKFGINLPDGIKNSINGMVQIDAKSLALVGTLAAVAKVVVDVEKKLISMTKASAEYADNILTMSTVTGISTEKLQEYTYAAELLDVSVETITGSQTKLINNMQEAAKGTENQAAAFERLGVSVTNADGSLRDTQEVFWETIDALGRIQNGTERDALAMDIMGKSAQDLNPLIKAGADRMQELADEAENVGYVLSEKELDALGKVDDAMQRLDNTTEGVKNQLSAEFAPYLESATEKWTDLIAGTGKALKDSGLIDGFGMLLDTFAGIIQPTDTLSGKSLPALTQALRPVAEVMAGIASTIELIASIVDIKSLFTKPGEYFKRIYTASGLGYNQGYKNQYQQLQDKYTQMGTNAATDAAGYGEYYANGKYYGNKDAYLRELYAQSGYGGTFEAWKVVNGYNASGNHNWRGGVTWVGENGPELVSLPRGSQIMTAQESREVGPTNFYITIDAKNVREFNDIVEIAKNARMNARKIHA